jgi:hypothetical protein
MIIERLRRKADWPRVRRMAIIRRPSRPPRPRVGFLPDGGTRALLWVPVAYACTRSLGESLPLLAVAFLAAALAGLHRWLPGPVEVAAGATSLLVTVNEVLDGPCREALGPGGTGVVIAFVTLFYVSAFVQFLGTGRLKAAGRHLLIATVTVELALSLFGPVVDGQGRVFAAVVLLVVLVAGAAVGLRAGFGVPLLAAGLLGVEASLALTEHSCGMSGGAPLVGTAAFVAAAFVLAPKIKRFHVQGFDVGGFTSDFGPGPDPEPPYDSDLDD